MICNFMDRYKTRSLFNMCSIVCKTERTEFERCCVMILTAQKSQSRFLPQIKKEHVEICAPSASDFVLVALTRNLKENEK